MSRDPHEESQMDEGTPRFRYDARLANEIELRWPSGQVDRLYKVAAGQTVTVKEGAGIVQQRPFGAPLQSPAVSVAGQHKAGK